jgi:hypothetical protein
MWGMKFFLGSSVSCFFSCYEEVMAVTVTGSLTAEMVMMMETVTVMAMVDGDEGDGDGDGDGDGR